VSEGVDPQRTALMIMDFQTDIVGRMDDSDALLERVARVRSACRRRGIQTIYVRVALTPDDRQTIPDRNKSFFALARGTDLMAEGSPAADIHPVLEPAPEDLVVTKKRTGSFSTTDLAAELDRRGIDTLILAGIATSGVVLSTVRDAADRDYRLFVLSDCCADPDPLVHDVLIERVLPRQAEVIASNSLDGLFAGERIE
jgi:nicotinamidase-related amidase